jgi:hypothetical protein
MKNKLKVYFKNLEAKRENIYIKKKTEGHAAYKPKLL